MSERGHGVAAARPRYDACPTHLEPMNRPSRRLVRRTFSFQHFHHQPLAALFHTLVEEDLNLFNTRRIVRSRERKLFLDWLQMLSQ